MGKGGSKELYHEFKKRFELPEFEIIDKELEVSAMDGDKFLLRTIRGKIKSRLENYCNMIEDLLSPDTSIPLLHECTFVTERSKARMLNLYKKLMYMLRMADHLEVEKSTAKDARYIKGYFDHLEMVQREMKTITTTRMNAWKKDLASYIKEEYFG